MAAVESAANVSQENGKSESPLPVKKHPLKQEWTHWFLNDQRNLDWEERLKAISTFGTVEDFWALYNAIKMPSQLNIACDYNVFKKGIAPKWEVPENHKGGRWLITIDKKAQDVMDIIWLEVLIAMIGEQFGQDQFLATVPYEDRYCPPMTSSVYRDIIQDLICGLVVNVRSKGSKISVWTRDRSNEEGNYRIGNIIKAKLLAASSDKSNPIFNVIKYEDHDACQTKNSSYVKATQEIFAIDMPAQN